MKRYSTVAPDNTCQPYEAHTKLPIASVTFGNWLIRIIAPLKRELVWDGSIITYSTVSEGGGLLSRESISRRNVCSDSRQDFFFLEGAGQSSCQDLPIASLALSEQHAVVARLLVV